MVGGLIVAGTTYVIILKDNTAVFLTKPDGMKLTEFKRTISIKYGEFIKIVKIGG